MDDDPFPEAIRRYREHQADMKAEQIKLGNWVRANPPGPGKAAGLARKLNVSRQFLYQVIAGKQWADKAKGRR